MKIEQNGKVLFVGWQYNNSKGERATHNPEVTTCIVKDENKVEIFRATIKRHVNDVNNKDKARRYSLAKLLKEQFPADKATRRKFWTAYLNRSEVPVS